MATDGEDMHRGRFDENEDTGVCLKADEYNPLSGKGRMMQKRKRENLKRNFLKTQCPVKFRGQKERQAFETPFTVTERKMVPKVAGTESCGKMRSLYIVTPIFSVKYTGNREERTSAF